MVTKVLNSDKEEGLGSFNLIFEKIDKLHDEIHVSGL